MGTPNILQNVPAALPRELVEVLAAGSSCRIERIVSTGQASPPGFWFDQEWDEWVIVLSGSARVRFEGGQEHCLVQGSYLHIPSHLKHRVEFTDTAQPTVWLAFHFPG